MTPLILSTQDPGHRDDHTRLLLEHGADPNITDNSQKYVSKHWLFTTVKCLTAILGKN